MDKVSNDIEDKVDNIVDGLIEEAKTWFGNRKGRKKKKGKNLIKLYLK